VAVLAMVEHLAGLQAQAPFPPYYGLWSRLDGFQPGDLADLLVSRRVVRIALMRSTIHLVSARDCLAFRPLMLHPEGALVVWGQWPPRENDGETVISVDLTDPDGVLRPHPH
jgi:winged helix DNA-binding protein